MIHELLTGETVSSDDNEYGGEPMLSLAEQRCYDDMMEIATGKFRELVKKFGLPKPGTSEEARHYVYNDINIGLQPVFVDDDKSQQRWLPSMVMPSIVVYNAIDKNTPGDVSYNLNIVIDVQSEDALSHTCTPDTSESEQMPGFASIDVGARPTYAAYQNLQRFDYMLDKITEFAGYNLQAVQVPMDELAGV